ncbi:MAG: MEDS domain-containing protein [Chloroflexota bacterium]|nr:MEDS domain-containing protein [Chloroflexota bacterium]
MKIQSADRSELLPIAEAMRGTVHAVQFYETDDYLLQTLADYVAGAFAAGDAAIVVATAARRSELEERLASRGIDVALMLGTGRTFLLTRWSSSPASRSMDPSARRGSPTSSAR